MPVSAPVYELTESTLDNGLRVVVSPDPTAPVVAMNIWYDVGSRHEQPGRTGLAHLFEHLMFEGSAQVGKGEHFRYVNEAGGTLNATTWCDRTNYFNTVPSNHLELLCWLEADRMWQLALTQETLDNQRAVVKNERRQRYENQPYGTWMERMHALVYPPGHPYHHSTIGSMDDLDAASLEDVAAFYAAHYRPDNAVLTIVGDVDAAEALETVGRQFRRIPRRVDPVPGVPGASLEPLIGTEHRETVREPVPVPRVFIGYRIAPFGSAEYDATVLLAAVLGAGRGARLYRRLVVEREIAQPGEGNLMDTLPFVGGASVAVADLVAREGVEPAALEAAYEQVLAEVAAGQVDEDELARARAVVSADWLGQVSGLDGRADAFSQYATLFGDPALANDVLPRYAEVEVADVVRVAAERLRPDNRAVLVFVPDAP
ncbi:MAG TPA: pitrilysin family protein [Mycobacteriales bacterium]|nr:pitrilysin family protein [Mycobacteriales bacterium]